MADPINPSINLFQAQSAANQQQFVVPFEAAKENERIKKFTETHREKMKQETEEISKEMGHEDMIVRHKEPSKRFPQDEKTEQRLEDEKKERIEIGIKGMDGDYLKELEKDLNDRRKAYAHIEIRDGIILAEVRKHLGSKNVEESIAVRSAREQYQKTLDRFKDGKISELKEKGLTGEPLKKELAELVRQFGYMEALELINARSDAKAELKMGNDIAISCWGILEKTANAYNKLPLWAKIGISAGVFASGAGLLIAGKRALGGLATGVATAKGLDALHQAKANKSATKEVEKAIARMDNITLDGTADEVAEKRYELMRSALDVKLDESDKYLKNHKMVSACNKFIGLGVGFFLGSEMASKAIAGAVEYFNPSEHVADTGVIAKQGADSLEQVKEQIISEKPTIIEKGSSIEGTLIKYYKEHGLKFDDNGYAAHHAYRDYMTDYIENNREELIKTGKLAEYQQMLKDGMVNVQPGTEIVIDPHTGNIISIDGKLSHLKHAYAGSFETGDVQAEVPVEAPTEVSADVSDAASVSPEVLHSANHEFAKIETEMQVEGAVKELGARIDVENMRVNQDVSMEEFNADTFNDRNELVEVRDRSSKLLEQLRADDAPWRGIHSIESLLVKDAGSHQILQLSLDKITEGQSISKLEYWQSIREKSLEDVIFSGKDEIGNKGAMGLLKEFYKIIGDKAMPIKDFNGNPETTRKWLARVTDLALKAKKS